MKIKLRNRLEVLMKDSGVNTFEEMAQRLTHNQGTRITRTALSRKFRDDDVTLSLSMIQAICNELQCLPGDLFETDVADASPAFVDELQSRLQPFRYGVIRLQKSGVGASDDGESEAEESDATARTLTKSSPSKKGQKPQHPTRREQEALEGPVVTHLHIGKLTKK